MKTFSIEEIIKILFSNNTAKQNELLTEYGSADEMHKAELTQIMSDQFLTLFDELAVLKYEKFMDEVSNGARQIESNMMQEAYRAVHEDLAKVLTGEHSDNQEIKALQQKIQSLSIASQ